MVYTTSAQSPTDSAFTDPTTGYYMGPVLTMVLTVGDRTVDITNPFAALSLVQIQDNLTFDGASFRDGYLARYSNPGAQPVDVDADVQLWVDTPDPSDTLTSDAYLSAPPPLARYPLAVMNFYGRDEQNYAMFDVIRGEITSINVVAVPEPSTVWLLLFGMGVLAVASRRRQVRPLLMRRRGG